MSTPVNRGVSLEPSRVSSLSIDERKSLFVKCLNVLINNKDDNAKTETLESLKILLREFTLDKGDMQTFKKWCETSLKEEIERLISLENPLWATLWKFAINTLGPELHEKTLLNNLLKVQEKVLKSGNDRLVVLALQNWRTLIDNFSLIPGCLEKIRRIELLQIPLRHNKIYQSLECLKAKLATWWHLIVVLKETNKKYLEEVLRPFLRFCFSPMSRVPEVQSLKLVNKFPEMAPDVANVLAVVLGFGLPGLQTQVANLIRECPEEPTFAILVDSPCFQAVMEEVYLPVEDCLVRSPSDEAPRVAFTALVLWILRLHMENNNIWQQAASELALTIDEILKRRPYLVNFIVEVVVKHWTVDLLDAKLKYHAKSISIREALLSRLLSPSWTIETYDESYVKSIQVLLEKPSSMVASPDTIATVKSIATFLTNMSEEVKNNPNRLLARFLSLSDHVNKMVVASLPVETVNEDCSRISAGTLLELVLLPLRCFINNNSSALNTLGEKLILVIPNWKSLVQKLIDVDALQLSVSRRDPISIICGALLGLVGNTKDPGSTVLFISLVVAQLSSIRINSRSGGAIKEEPNELDVLLILTETMSQGDKKDNTQIAKALKVFDKVLSGVVHSQSQLEPMVTIFKIYAALLKFPLTRLDSRHQNLAEHWSQFCGRFRKFSVIADLDRELKKYLRELLVPIEKLVSHSNIKIAQGAAELGSAIENLLAAKRGTAAKVDELKLSPKRTTPPHPGKRRGRKSLLTLAQASSMPPPVPAATSSTARSSPRPSLEDQDSQDFVKIPPKPQSKKVLTPHQKELRKRRADDIPALYQGLSQDTFDSQDTQDTQDVNVPAVSVIRKSGPRSILFDEDANDAIPGIQKLPSEPSSESSRPILEPIQPDNNKDPQVINNENEVVIIDSDSEAEVVTKENLGNKKDSADVSKGAKEASDSESSPELEGDQPMKEVQDTQDDEIVENSQGLVTLPSREVSVCDEGEKAKVDVRVPRLLINRQGVKVLSGEKKIERKSRRSSGFELGTMLSGRAAKLLNMVTGDPTLSPSTASSTRPPVVTIEDNALNSSAGVTAEEVQKEPPSLSSPVRTQQDPNPPVLTPTTAAAKRSNLKRPKGDEEDEAGSPSPKKKKVNFAEPIVSSTLESPKCLEDAINFKRCYPCGSGSSKMRASPRSKYKKILFCREITSAVDCSGGEASTILATMSTTEVQVDFEQAPSQGSLRPPNDEDEGEQDAPLCPELEDNLDPVEAIAGKLSSPMYTSALVLNLKLQGYETVGDLSMCSRLAVVNLDIKEPKVETLRAALKDYLAEKKSLAELKTEVVDISDDVDDVRPLPEEQGDMEQEEREPSEQPEPIVEEPEPGQESAPAVPEKSLADQLKDLVSKHSLEEVLKSLAPHSEILECLQASQTSSEEEQGVQVPRLGLRLRSRGRVQKGQSDSPPSSQDAPSKEEQLTNVIKASTVPQVLTSLGQTEQVLEYCASTLPRSTLIKKLFSTLQEPEIVEDEASKEVLANDSMPFAALVFQCMDPSTIIDIATTYSDPLSVIESFIQRTKEGDRFALMSEIIRMLLNTRIPQSFEETCYRMLSEALIMRTGPLKLPNVLISLSPYCQNVLCNAVLLTAKDYLQTEIVSKLSNEEILAVLASRRNEGTIQPEDYQSEEFKTLCSGASQEVLCSVLEVMVQEGNTIADVDELVLNNISCTDLLQYVLKKSATDKISFNDLRLEDTEEVKLFEVVKALPLPMIVDRLQVALDAGEQQVCDLSLLKYMTTNQVMAHLCDHPEDSSEDPSIRNKLLEHLIENLATESVLSLAAKKLEASKCSVSGKTIKLLKSLASKHVPPERVIDIIKDRDKLGNEKFEILELLLTNTSTEEVMSRMAIKDVMKYYGQLVIMPEYKASIIKMTVEKSSDDDVARFLGPERLFVILKSQLQHKPPLVEASRVAELLPPPRTEEEVVAGLENKEENVEMLRLKLSRELLLSLLTKLVLPTNQ